MTRQRYEPRPLPEQVIVVAFPDAWSQSSWPSGAPQPDGDFFVVQANSQEVVLPRHVIDWLTLHAPTPLGTDISRVDYLAQTNVQGKRSLVAPVIVKGKSYEVTFIQQPGDLVQDELARTLNCPLNLDCQIAVGFVANLIQKIPVPPIKYIVLLIAMLAILVLAGIVMALRHAFAGVPEPRPLSTDIHGVPIVIVPGIPVPFALPTKAIAAEDQTIGLQAARAIYWLAKLAL
ncbi:hypothetical protein HDE76_000673 [Rhodanobacter sp. ANJX3]|uniref:hypothetical protein n=1 Tax=Rhodanobacter sp. ANJX3 TaxID=2723083 RepID=UPI001790D9FD|nr:hypothetical protein [Rhodanobacter sp. ANJX3]MBB5357491.1 hypothetical protein [Rhodanobacter sp. ANJX3]